jgi:predicted nucleic acid-binding protein
VIHNVLLDAGPLAALINPRDQWHAWARAQFAEIVPPLLTCQAVVSEACFLARRAHGGLAGILGLIERRVVVLDLTLKDHFDEVSALMHKYMDVPMSVADGCLVRMSELVGTCTVLTLDSDFRIYRRHKRQRIPLLLPPNL